MGKLQTKAQRRYRYETIAKAEGEQCLACYIERGKRRGPPRVRLVIEHADNDQSNWSWENIHLCCYSHNKKLEKLSVHEKFLLFRSYSDQIERERDRENLPTWKTVLKDLIPYEEASAELRANKIYFKRWNNYVHADLEKNGSVNRKDLILAAAGKVGCSKQTSTNYMEVQTAITGPYKEDEDADGNKIIVFRHESKAHRISRLGKKEVGA